MSEQVIQVVSDEPIVEPVAPEVVTSEPTVTRWSDGFASDIRDHPITQRLENPEAGIRELIGAQKLIGADKVVIPGEDSTPEERDAFYTKLGRPAKVDDYDLSSVEIPEGLPVDEEFQKGMVEKMHALGLNSTQVSGVLKDYYEATGGQYQTSMGDLQRGRETAEQDLRNEWGRSYDANIDLANRALKAGAGEKFEELVGLKMADGSELGSHPDVVRCFAKLGGNTGEHGLVSGTPARSILSPKEASTKRNELMGDQEFLAKYTSNQHPQHAWAVDQIKNLTEMEYVE